MKKPAQSGQPPPYSWLLSGYFHRKRDYRSLRDRGTDDWLLFYTLSGAGRFVYAKTELLAGHDDLMLYAPGTPQDYGLPEGRGEWEFLWFHFRPRPEWLELLKWPAVAPGLMRLAVTDRALHRRLLAAARGAHHAASAAHRFSTLQAMHALEEFFLLCMGALPRTRELRLDTRIEQAMEYVQRHLRSPLTREALARQVGLSTHRFAHLFQEQVGRSPRQFVEEERLKLARHLLETTSATISEIAAEAGFPNLFYFSQRFKTATGHSPTAFREGLRARMGANERVAPIRRSDSTLSA